MLLEPWDTSLSDAARGRPLYFRAKPPALLSAVPREMPGDNSPVWCGSGPRLCSEWLLGEAPLPSAAAVKECWGWWVQHPQGAPSPRWDGRGHRAGQCHPSHGWHLWGCATIFLLLKWHPQPDPSFCVLMVQSSIPHSLQHGGPRLLQVLSHVSWVLPPSDLFSSPVSLWIMLSHPNLREQPQVCPSTSGPAPAVEQPLPWGHAGVEVSRAVDDQLALGLCSQQCLHAIAPQSCFSPLPGSCWGGCLLPVFSGCSALLSCGRRWLPQWGTGEVALFRTSDHLRWPAGNSQLSAWPVQLGVCL